MRNVSGWSTRSSLVVGILAATTISAGATQKVQSSLIPTASAPTAQGSAKLVVKTASSGRFQVKVKKLAHNATFAVLIGGTKVGTVTTSGGGNGKITFSTTPKGHDVAMGFDPSGDPVEVRDDAGDDVLTGDVPETGDPAAVTCCIPGGSECEDRTADECTAAGGTVNAATSCLPDPCGDSASGALVACCESEDDGTPECELRTATACLEHGGTSLTDTVCDPNPCTATFPSTDIQCCLPHGGDGEVECEDRTPDACTAQGGVNMGAGSCNPDPCTGAGEGGDGGGDGSGGGGSGPH